MISFVSKFSVLQNESGGEPRRTSGSRAAARRVGVRERHRTPRTCCSFSAVTSGWEIWRRCDANERAVGVTPWRAQRESANTWGIIPRAGTGGRCAGTDLLEVAKHLADPLLVRRGPPVAPVLLMFSSNVRLRKTSFCGRCESGPDLAGPFAGRFRARILTHRDGEAARVAAFAVGRATAHALCTADAS